MAYNCHPKKFIPTNPSLPLGQPARILFNYTILRDTKDVLMVTAPKSGAEVRTLLLLLTDIFSSD